MGKSSETFVVAGGLVYRQQYCSSTVLLVDVKLCSVLMFVGWDPFSLLASWYFFSEFILYNIYYAT